MSPFKYLINIKKLNYSTLVIVTIKLMLSLLDDQFLDVYYYYPVFESSSHAQRITYSALIITRRS